LIQILYAVFSILPIHKIVLLLNVVLGHFAKGLIVAFLIIFYLFDNAFHLFQFRLVNILLTLLMRAFSYIFSLDTNFCLLIFFLWKRLNTWHWHLGVLLAIHIKFRAPTLKLFAKSWRLWLNFNRRRRRAIIIFFMFGRCRHLIIVVLEFTLIIFPNKILDVGWWFGILSCPFGALRRLKSWLWFSMT
jgi:hypothetical protein